MEKIRLALLTAEIKAQLSIIDEIYQKIEERASRAKSGDSVVAESLAYQIHNLYCAFEDLFKTVAMFFENNIEDPAKYHAELLKRMSIQVEGVRPALIDRESLMLLDSLRAFRHFFRHAYSYEVQLAKVNLVLEDVLLLKSLYKAQVEEFIKQVS